uniref:Transient receptor potential cation channel n=1 Tax=Echinococcus granulosus TaxID=6210 RepID=A0A068WVT9_ECHGR|nr:transient receptor potential cation channel [Echinococcus granulosus]
MRSTSMHPSKSASSSSRTFLFRIICCLLEQIVRSFPAARIHPTWIEEKITQLKCVEYVPSNDSSNRCNCGRLLEEHDHALSRAVRMSSAMCQIESEGERWQIKRHTCEVPTTAFGTVEFQGGPHPTKARVCFHSFTHIAQRIPMGFLQRKGSRRGTDRACFRYPYTELLQWALLFSLAQFMVLSGEEAIAKALLSVRILRGMRKLMGAEVGTELIKVVYAQEKDFENLAVELQEQCYRQDSAQARRLLTYERCNFSRNTCLSLAYMCESKSFIAHPCAQTILSDLWYGGLREDRFISAKIMLILLGLSMPPLYPLIALCFAPFASNFLEFKTTTSSPSSSRRSSLSSSNIKDDEGTQPQRTTSGPLWRNRFFQDEVGIVENKSHHTVLLDKVSILGKDHNISASSSSLNENGDTLPDLPALVPPLLPYLRALPVAECLRGVHLPPHPHSRYRSIYKVFIHILLEQMTKSPGGNYHKKMRVHLSSFWNIYDFLLSFFSVLGVIVRMVGLQNRIVFLWGRNILVCCYRRTARL